MEVRIRSNFLCVLVLSVIFIIQKSDCASLSRQEGKLPIALEDRATCLEKLICGINVVGTKSAVKDYSNQVDLIRRFFKLYPLAETNAAEADDETKLEAEVPADADDDSEELASVNDYNVELEDIVHKPKPKPKVKPKRTSSKRKKTKNQASKVIFGNTGLPISESISLTGRLIKANRKNANAQTTPAPTTPQPELRTEDETIMTLLNQKQIMERMARKLAGPRQARRQNCGEIVCPHTFKQLYQSLQASLDSDDEESPAPELTQYTEPEDEKSSEEILKVSALSQQNLPTQGAYTISGGHKVSQMTGMEGFFHATDELQNPPTSKYSSKKKKKQKVKKTKKPLKGTLTRPSTKTSKTAQKKAMIAHHDVVGTIAPPHKVIRYRPSKTEEDAADNDDNGDDEVDDINKTRPVKLVGHPQYDEDVKEIQKKLKQPPSVHHREEDGHDDEQGTSASDENHDDYDEEAKYNVPVDYGNDENDDDEEDEDDDVTEEDQIRSKPKRVKKKPKPVIKTIVKTVANKPINNPSIDYFETSATIKRVKDKAKDADDAADSSEEYLDDEDNRSLNINSETYSSIYSRDPMNIGGRPMTPPGEIPVEMTSMGMGLTHRQRSGGGQKQPQPNLLVRHQSRPQSMNGNEKNKQGADSDEVSVEAPTKQGHSYASAVQQSSPAYVHSSDPTEISTGLSFSRLTAPFQSIFKLVKEGSMFQSGSNAPFQQAQSHYQYNPNPRPMAFNQQTFMSPAQNTHKPELEPERLSVVKPAPAPPPPSFNPIVLPRPVGPESSNFKRYKVEKKENKIPGRNPVF